MPFQLSLGVNVSEVDLTTVIPAVATTEAAIGGVFRWGPVDKFTLVTNESELVNDYGKPTNDNAETFFTAASFLSYADALYVSRAHHSTGEIFAKTVQTIEGSQSAFVYNDDNLDADSNPELQTTMEIYNSNFRAGTTIVSIDLSSKTFTFANTDIVASNITVSGHNFIVGDRVTLTTDAADAPDGMAAGTYYVVSVVNDAIELSGSVGGTPITPGDGGSGTHTLTSENDIRLTMTQTAAATAVEDSQLYDADFSFNAIANTISLGTNTTLNQFIIKNDNHFDGYTAPVAAGVPYVAKYPGAIGNSIKISVCDSAAAYNSKIDLTEVDGANAVSTFEISIGENTGTLTTDQTIGSITAQIAIGDLIKVGNSSIGTQYLEVTAIETAGSTATLTFGDRLAVSENISISTEIDRYWGYYGLVEAAPGQSNYVRNKGNVNANDEMHVVVVDNNGEITGVPGQILEVFQRLSRGTDAKNDDGASIYYQDIINQTSRFVWSIDDRAGAASADAINVVSSTNVLPFTSDFVAGKDIGNESTCNLGDILRAYDIFKSAEDVDISLVLTGKARGGSSVFNGAVVNNFQLANYLIDNVAERRKDCVVFASPDKGACVNNVNGEISEDVVNFRNALRSTSYAVMDSGYKYMYDKYNDVYRWVPINGDTAGLCAYTDDTRDPWWSPAGFNRGQLKNVVKLSWNPKKAERDVLYKAGVNPIVNFPGQGIVMFGDKTLLDKPSAFDRINVRRLFIVLEKAIATASKSTLFEFNDEFTRSSFVNLVTPYLRDIQGRRGVYDFAVICDETNNTPEVIDRNEFVGDIYIKPARSINFIQLNFVAVRSGVEFSEVIGNF